MRQLRRPYPQYVFRRRGDRQRMAIRLARGMGVAEVAAVERAPASAIKALLADGCREHSCLLGEPERAALSPLQPKPS